MAADTILQFAQLLREFLVSGQLFTHSDKCPDNTNACLNRNRTVEHTGQHNRAMLGKNPRQFAFATVQT